MSSSAIDLAAGYFLNQTPWEYRTLKIDISGIFGPKLNVDRPGAPLRSWCAHHAGTRPLNLRHVEIEKRRLVRQALAQKY